MKRAYAKILDVALESFSHGPVDSASLYRKNLPFDNEIIGFLIADGSLKDNGQQFEITYKGRMRVNGNGFVREHRIQVRTYVASIVAAVASVITIITYFLDKFHAF
jgi:hypothetical protein